MMKQNILLPIFIVSFIFFSCNKKNKSNPSTINSIDVKYDSAITAKNQIIIPKISMPNTVVLEADLSIQSESFSQDISAKFKFKNEDTTWISITGIFGIEGARILITKDTFHLLDRINRKYITGPVSMSKKLLPIQLDLNSFQSLIMGYAAYAIDSSFFSS